MPALLATFDLTETLQVIAFAGAVVTFRPLILGFLALARGESTHEIRNVITMGAVSSVPMAALVAIAVTLYLLFT